MFTPPGHDHTSNSTPSLDGKGGADLASQDGKSRKRTGPNFGVPYPETSTCGFSGLIYSCSILSSIHQTRCIRIKSRPLLQQPFHWSHSIKINCSSPYGGIYKAVLVQTWGPLGTRQGTCLHTALKPSTQRRLCPPIFICSFWPRPFWTRSNCVGCRVGEEDRGGHRVGQAAGTLWWYRHPLR